MLGNANLARDFSAYSAGHKTVQPLRQLALRLVGKQLVKARCNREAKHTVAQKFKPLVIPTAKTAMRKGARIKRLVARFFPDKIGEPGEECRFTQNHLLSGPSGRR